MSDEKKMTGLEKYRAEQKAIKEAALESHVASVPRKLTDNELAKIEQRRRHKEAHAKLAEAKAIILEPDQMQCQRCHTIFTKEQIVPARVMGIDKNNKPVVVFQSPFSKPGCPHCYFPAENARKYDPKVDVEKKAE